MGCPERAPDEDALAIENVTVVPMTDDQIVSEQTVLVTGDAITEVGSADEVEIPDGAIRVDGSGQYLMPGLAEMHAHLPSEEDPEAVQDAMLYLFASQGVTFARGMLGEPLHLDMQQEIETGERFGPRLRVASPMISGNAAETPEEGRELVQQYAEEGYDLLKIGEGLDLEVYEAIAEEADEIGIPFGGHVSDDVGLQRSMEAGHVTVDHLDNYVEALRTEDAPDEFAPLFGIAELLPHLETDRIPELVEQTAETGTAVVPTMVLWERFFGDTPPEAYREEYPELRYIPGDMIEGWEGWLGDIRENFEPEEGAEIIEIRRDMLRALYEDEEARILLGSDAPQMFNVPGFSVHHEMQFMQDEIGMESYDVLRSGTRDVAEFYDAEDEFGTIEVGQRADLILTNDNPLDDVAHAADISGVAVDGRWMDAQEIESELEAIAEEVGSESE